MTEMPASHPLYDQETLDAMQKLLGLKQEQQLKSSIQLDLLLLDCLLTGKDPRSMRGRDNWLPEVGDEPAGTHLYYCSDGGYSRIGLNMAGQPVLHTENGLRRVAWETEEDILQIRLRIARNFQKLGLLLSGMDAAAPNQPEEGASDAAAVEGAVAPD